MPFSLLFDKIYKLPMLTFALVALPAGVALAQMPDDGQGRYSLTPVDGGVLRLDKATGGMALCIHKADQWACEPVQDRAGAASGDKMSKLESENKTLKDRIKVLEDSLAIIEGANKSGTPEAAPDITKQLPTDEEVDKAFDYVERIIKKFRERVQKYGSPDDPTAPGTPKDTPDNTPGKSSDSKPL